MGVRHVIDDSGRDFKPSDEALNVDFIFEQSRYSRMHEQNKVLEGMMATPPSTPSSQLAGVGNTTWNIDLVGGLVVVDGVVAEIADAADVSIHSGSLLMANGLSCVAAVVAKNVSGTITVVAVKGTAATTGTQVAPLDGTIQAAVGAANTWVKLAECTLNRTGDATVTQSQNNTFRPVLGVNVSTNYGDIVGL